MSTENVLPNYYAIIPASVRYDKRLKPIERLMYGELTCLSNMYGYCTATNNYFAKLYDVSKETVSRWISTLKKYGYINIELVYEDNSKEIKERRIFIATVLPVIQNTTPIDENVNTPIDEKINTPIDENVKDNNTSSNINIKRNNNKQSNNVVEAYKDATGKNATKQTINKLNDLVSVHGEAKVIHAITRNDKTITIAYITKLVESWTNYKTIDEIENAIKQHNTKKTKSYTKKPIRTELVPEWLNNEPKQDDTLSESDLQKIEEMKKLQASILLENNNIDNVTTDLY